LFKTLTCILAVTVIAEGGYIFWHRYPNNRFKLIDDDGYVAFDTASGQLCRTFHPRSAPNRVESAPSSDRSPAGSSGDVVLDFIQNGATRIREDQDAKVKFLLGLPACGDIR